MAGLSIKNERTELKIRELAKLAGEGITEAIENAVDERMEKLMDKARGHAAKRRQKKEDDFETFLSDIRQMSKELRAGLPEPITSDHSDLYDEDGLPI